MRVKILQETGGGEAQDVEANKACLSEETGRLLKSWMY